MPEYIPKAVFTNCYLAEACNRIPVASLDAAVHISFSCILPWFPGILLDSLSLFPITFYGIFQSINEKTAACATEEQSKYLFQLL